MTFTSGSPPTSAAVLTNVLTCALGVTRTSAVNLSSLMTLRRVFTLSIVVTLANVLTLTRVVTDDWFDPNGCCDSVECYETDKYFHCNK